MPAISRKYSAEEISRRGDEWFESTIKPQIPPGHEHDFLVIDIETGQFEYDEDPLVASDRLEARIAEAEVYLRKVGSPIVWRFRSPRRVSPTC